MGRARPAAPSTATPTLNLKQVAARLGVHYMTAYRYARQGHLPAERVGTEWRISEDDLAAFLAERAGGRATAPATGEAGTDGVAAGAGDGPVDWRARLEACLLAGDEPASWRVVDRALASGHDPAYCYLDVVAAALASVGARWEAGELDVADQHVATAVAQRIVARLGARFRRPGRSRGSVVFGAPTGELHSLPIAIVADLVRLARFDVLELGANVPAAAFAAAAGRAPRLVAVGIGFTNPDNLPAVRATVERIAAACPHVPVVVGGQAVLNPEVAQLTGATAWAPDGRGAVAVIEDLASPRRS